MISLKMLFRINWIFLYFFTFVTFAGARCPRTVLDTLPFILDYAVWRGWRQVVFYTVELETGCNSAIMRLIKCLGNNGIATAKDITSEPNIQSHLGIVLLLPKLGTNSSENFKIKMKKLHDSEYNKAWCEWLITARSYNDFEQVNIILNDTAIRFDENIVGVYPLSKHISTIENSGLCYNLCSIDATARFTVLKNQIHPAHKNYNFSKRWYTMNVSRLFLIASRRNIDNKNKYVQCIYLVQYFKVRTNSTLYGTLLGIWNEMHSMSSVEQPYPVETRTFMGERFVFGRSNTSDEGSDLYEEDHPASILFNDVLNFLTIKVNATSSVRYYNKLGYQTYEGSWTGLLGALMDNSVDVALEPVTTHTPRYQDMDFIFPITETMFNIYVRDQETAAVRDIYLAPFKPILLVCVFAVILFITTAMLIISRYTPHLSSNGSWGFTEAIIWSIGILCQQGSTRMSTSPASCVLLIVSLLFALVTYNSYAAFITSVLSVRVATVDTVTAVLLSPNMKIGYIRNGPDQIYLMSTSDAQLNEFYIRGYSEAENLVASAEEGVLRAATQDYAFFTEQRTGRSTLRSLSQDCGRCSLRELALPTTRAHLAFPIARGSPYSRSVLISFLQLRSAGVLARLASVLVPAMPMCSPPPPFASAKATDVRSALVLFLIGFITSVFIGLAEYCWSKRNLLKKHALGYSRRCRNFFN